MVMTPSLRMIIKTMIKNSFIKIILFFLTNYVVVIDGTCFQDNTYITYAGNERFPSTNEKSAELCQSLYILFWEQYILTNFTTLLTERCQKEHECSFWVFHKPIGTCFLQAWKETTLHDNEYLSGPKYCDCYVEENHIFDDPSSSSLEKNLEDCRSLSTVM